MVVISEVGPEGNWLWYTIGEGVGSAYPRVAYPRVLEYSTASYKYQHVTALGAVDSSSGLTRISKDYWLRII
jgi:hypothetical protein